MSGNNSMIECVAHKVASYAAVKDEKYSVDPIIVLTIISIIVNVTRLIYECRKDKNDITDQIQNRSLVYKFLLRKEIRKKCKERKDRDIIYQAMLDVSKNLSMKEIFSIIEEVENKK